MISHFRAKGFVYSNNKVALLEYIEQEQKKEKVTQVTRELLGLYKSAIGNISPFNPYKNAIDLLSQELDELEKELEALK